MRDYPTPLDHAETILSEFRTDAIDKYLTGQREHGGRLHRKPVLNMLYQEVLDLPIYLLTLREQLTEVQRLLGLAMIGGSTLYVRQALDILETGNPEGVMEEER